jgi:hypothetical protein
MAHPIDRFTLASRNQLNSTFQHLHVARVLSGRPPTEGGFEALEFELGETTATVRSRGGSLRGGDQRLSAWEVPAPASRIGSGFIEPEGDPEVLRRGNLQKVAAKVFTGRLGAEKLARQVLRHRGELEDFTYDHFPEVYKFFWERMPLSVGYTLLVENTPPDKLVGKLTDVYSIRVVKALSEAKNGAGG